MGDSPITFTVQLTPQDLFRANLWMFMRRSWWLFGIMVVSALVVLAVDLFPADPSHNIDVSDFYVIFAVMLCLLIWVPACLYFGARSRFKQQKGLRQANRYTLSTDGVKSESDSSSGQVDWSHIYSASENKNYFFLHLSKAARYVIPKRALPDQETIRSLRQMLRDHVKGKVRLLS